MKRNSISVVLVCLLFLGLTGQHPALSSETRKRANRLVPILS